MGIPVCRNKLQRIRNYINILDFRIKRELRQMIL